MKKVARFEKVSLEQFGRDLLKDEGVCNDDEFINLVYGRVKIPKRATKYSAGHDIVCPLNLVLQPNVKIQIPTGIRCKMDEDVVMLITPRSSLGIKKGLFISNTVPVIDADYYNAKNEGHIFLSIENRGDKLMAINAGDAIAQAIFVPYFVADDEEIVEEREGGIGSTNKN